jgi:hypothetical protein
LSLPPPQAVSTPPATNAMPIAGHHLKFFTSRILAVNVVCGCRTAGRAAPMGAGGRRSDDC